MVEYLEEVGVKAFYNNALAEPYVTCDGKRIQAGTKVIKSFKYFITATRLLEEIQNKASEIIQENKIEGYLCFSVHPLDYLSSSENNYNWRSCHALDGEYRAGNLSYMCDSSTMVVYLRAERPTQLKRFPDGMLWNDKKWRCLFHWTSDLNVVFAGRQYPFFSPGALETIREIMIEHLLPKKIETWFGGYLPLRYSHWHNDRIKSFTYEKNSEEDEVEFNNSYYDYIVIDGKIVDMYKWVRDNPNASFTLHFNDLLISSYYHNPYYMFTKDSHIPDNLTVGSDTIQCLCCGKEAIITHDTVMCPDCEVKYGNSENTSNYPVCDLCGGRFYRDTGHWVCSDLICPTCTENCTFICERCGERHYNENKVYVARCDQFWCADCASEEE